MISQAQSVLLEAIKASLFDIQPNYLSNNDICWDDVITEAKTQTVMGLISPVIPVRDESSEHCKAMYMRIMYEQDKLLKCFAAAQIPCVILKGSAASVYYPKPYLRTMGDIDVLVPSERFIDSLKILEANGYIYDHGQGHDEQVFDETRELAYTKNGIYIEIHQRFSSPGVDVDDILEPAIERREFCNLNGYRFPMLPTPENGLVLLGHLNQHLKNNVLGLRQIIDWEMYVHSVKDKASWLIQFMPLIEKADLVTLAAYFTRMCNRHLGLPDVVNFGVDVDDILVDELLEVVLTDGNFGRRVNADCTSDEKKIVSVSYNIKREGFFRFFTQVGLRTSAFCRKHPSNKILAFLYGFFRLLGRGIIALFNNKSVGTKLVEGTQMYELHTKRQELYKKLGVRTGE